jgi:CBS domain-containing protein
MAQPIVKFKAPLSMFGHIVSEESKKDKIIDIKKMLLPITGFIRLYALRHKLHETNSLARSEKLFELKLINKPLYDELILSYNYLMLLRFRFQTSKILQNEMPDNLVDADKLTHIEKTTLKKIFSEIGNLQTQVNFDFKGTM